MSREIVQNTVSGKRTGSDSDIDPTRRLLLAGAGAVSVLGVAGPALAAPAGGYSHGHGNPRHGELIRAANRCTNVGQACLAHIFREFKGGDTTLAECGILVENTITTCNTLVTLAHNQAEQLPDMTAVCLKVCEACEVECRKHGKKHPICLDMAEACQAVVKACREALA